MANVINIFTISLEDSEILSNGSFTSEIYYAIPIAISFCGDGGNRNCNRNPKHGIFNIMVFAFDIV